MDDSNSSQGIGDGLMDEGGGGEKNITLPSKCTAEEATSSSMPQEKQSSFMYL